MKKNYELEQIKKWTFENGVEVKLNDIVKVHFDLAPGDVSNDFLREHPDNEVVLRISKINSRVIEGEIAQQPWHYLFLYPKNIVDIELCNDKTDLFPHRFSGFENNLEESNVEIDLD